MSSYVKLSYRQDIREGVPNAAIKLVCCNQLQKARRRATVPKADERHGGVNLAGLLAVLRVD